MDYLALGWTWAGVQDWRSRVGHWSWDIYFLTGLSCRGAQANLTGGRPNHWSTLELDQAYGIPESGLISSKVPIERIRLRSMRANLWLIVRLAGSKNPHVAIKAQLLLVVECVQPQMFNWCEAVLRHLKAELTACKTQTQQSFGYGTLIVSFILERVPVMRLRMSLGPFDLREPRQGQRASLNPHIGGGPIWHFFEWLSGQIVMIDDYAYEGMDFIGDPDLMLPLGTN